MANQPRRPELPRTATVPMPPPRGANGPEAFGPPGVRNPIFGAALHEDVGRAMQNVIDLQAEVERMRVEKLEWERRAVTAEGLVASLRQEATDRKAEHASEVGDLKHRHGEEVETMKKRHATEVGELKRDLDHFRNKDAVIQTKLHAGARHFLECIMAAEGDSDRPVGLLESIEKKALSAIEHELLKTADGTIAHDVNPGHGN